MMLIACEDVEKLDCSYMAGENVKRVQSFWKTTGRFVKKTKQLHSRVLISEKCKTKSRQKPMHHCSLLL